MVWPMRNVLFQVLTRLGMRVLPVIVLVGVLVAPLWGRLSLPAAARAQELTAFHLTADGTLAFRYPADWTAVEVDGSVIVANSQQALDVLDSGEPLAAGQAALILLSPAAAAQRFAMFGMEPESNPVTLTKAYLQAIGEQREYVFPLMIGDYPAARGLIQVNGKGAMLYMVVYSPTEVVVAVLTAGPGEAPSYDAMVRSLLADADVFAVPVLPETVSIAWHHQWPIDADDTDPDAFGTTGPISVDLDDTIYLLDPRHGIHRFDADGVPLGTIPIADLLVDFVVTVEGTLWGVTLDGTLIHANSAGQVLDTITLPPDTITLNAAVALGPDENLYVLGAAPDPESDGEVGVVLVYTPQGEQVRSFTVGRAEYVFQGDIAFGTDGSLYLATSYGSDRPGITAFSPLTGELQQEALASEVLVYGVEALVAAPDGTFYAVSLAAGEVYHLSADGRLLARFGDMQPGVLWIGPSSEPLPPFEPGEFYAITGLGILSSGDIVVADNNQAYAQLMRLTFDAFRP